jgi:integrase
VFVHERANGERDTRFRALVLLSAFASLRSGEVTALRRCDVDVTAGTIRVRAAFAELRQAGTWPEPASLTDQWHVNGTPARRLSPETCAILHSSLNCGVVWSG